MDQLSEGKQLFNVLEHASDSCYCESYFNYRCSKCIATGKDF